MGEFAKVFWKKNQIHLLKKFLTTPLERFDFGTELQYKIHLHKTDIERNT
jgi:hypothetical protein